MEITNYWEKNYQTKTFPDIRLDNSTYLPENSSISLQNHNIEIKRPGKNKMLGGGGGGKRGEVQNFSRQSRRRCLLQLATINFSAYKVKFFATFTFDEIFPTTKEELKPLLFNLIKRIERMPSYSGLFWRVEYQKRGAPHIHTVIFFNSESNLKNWSRLGGRIKRAWGKLTSDINPMSYTRGSEVIEVRKDEYLYFYLSKYISKVDEKSTPSKLGRIWGVRGNLAKQEILTEEVPEEIANEFIDIYKSSVQAKFPITDEYNYYLTQCDNVRIFIPFTHLRAAIKLIMKDYPSWLPSTKLKELLRL